MLSSEELRKLFLFRPDITFLNFGSFGSCPKPIFEEYQQWQMKLEADPVQFITVLGIQHLKDSREALANYVHCAPEDLVFVVNPTFAVNAVAKSLNLQPGDEILTTNLEYGASDRTWEFVCEETGAKYIHQKIQLPIVSKEQIIADFFKGFTQKTKLIFISQITSATGLILPVKEICEIAKSRAVLTFIDGAHVPGQIPLNLSDLQVDFYIGACHKWMMAPKGCSFLMATKAAQKLLKPLVVSWGYKSMYPSDSLFLDHFQMIGTRDFSAFLCIKKSIEFLHAYEWEKVRDVCHRLLIENAPRFCELLGTQPLAPLTSEFFAQLFSIPIHTQEPEKLHRLLVDEYRIEIPLARDGENVYLRYSIQGFNSQKDLDILYAALVAIIQNTDLIEVV
jgi:isopenicillin-N epimerase